MSKAYKGQPCAYCCLAESTTADHVIARAFFPSSMRGELPKVGACERCNNEKSKLEHTLTAVLPFGARHSGAHAALLAVERRLARNNKLHQLLATGIRYALRSVNGGPWQQEMTVPVDAGALERLGEYIVKGLARYHWSLDVGPDYFVRASFLNEQGRAGFDPFFSGEALAKVSHNYGEGVFTYEGVQAKDNPQLTLWRMSLYGIEAGGDPKASGERVSIMYGVTLRKAANAASTLAKLFGG